ncbi:MAG: choice-of-anchor B family protein [Woeseiaceae bacterium]|nr:choice-of-anchor B family protein [Woeseiaceae bacterium]
MLRRLACLPLLLLASSLGYAHSELDKPIFVAPGGQDTGRCEDVEHPCASIGYALSNAGKGNQIRVSVGRFQVTDVSEVFHLVSGTLDIRGGFDRETGEATGQKTVLVGVPSEYRATLAGRGFHVVADQKGNTPALTKQTAVLLKQRETMQAGLSAAPCQSGTVGGLECSQVDLLGHVPFNAVSTNPSRGADVWGFVDLNTNREYAIMGYGTGTAVFDISDPTSPREVGFIDGQSTIWRDIKVHQRYDPSAERFEAFAYVTTDGAGDGLFVIDMTDLPHRISRVSYASDFSAAHNVFAINSDYATGLPIKGDRPGLIVAGSNNGTGVFRSYSLDAASSPFFEDMPPSGESSCPGNDGCYMHDAASMIIDDSRISQCPNATTYCEVLFDFNESTIDLWDVTDASNPVRLSRTPYSNSRYTHSGWPSEDKQTLFVHDELDERDLNLNTTVRSFSIADLSAPTPLGVYTGANDSIDHNGFVRGNRYYMSNYSNGLTVLDITNPAIPTRIGFLDTYPAPAGSSFVGAWGAYPYFPSGVIAISDIDSGLYIAEDQTLGVAEGSLSFSSPSFGVAEGGSAALRVDRIGGSAGAVSVDYEIIGASGDENDIAASGTLSWANGDADAKSIAVDALVDGQSEPLEQLIVRLIAPTDGATLSAPAETMLYIGDSVAVSEVQFDTDRIVIAERGFGTAIAIVERAGSAVGAISVDYSVNDLSATAGSDYSGPTSGTLSWADGDARPQWIEFPISDDGSGEPTEEFEIVLSDPQGASLGAKPGLTVAIQDADGANEAPNANAGPARTVGGGTSVTLDGTASTDPDGDTLSYAWTQTMGPTVSIANASSARASFTAPSVASDTLLRFELRVSDPSGESDTASVGITVSAPTAPQPPDAGGGGGGGVMSLWALLLLLMAAVMRHRGAMPRL